MIRYLRRFLKRHKPAVPRVPDPLVGKFFLAISQCANCNATGVTRKGVIVERIPDAWAYLIQPYSLDPECMVAHHFRIERGWEMVHWRFYTWMSDLVIDEQEIARNAPQHAHHSEQVN
jgi:hypothetical protein